MLIPLFDMDWTLAKGQNKAHNNSFVYALEKVYGIKVDINDIIQEGMIDNQILSEALKIHGIYENDDQKFKKLTIEMVNYFKTHLNEAEFKIMPGALNLLSELKKRNFLIGLLTGNTEQIAYKKLEKVGLRTFINFGAFGDEALKRTDLVYIALKKAKKINPLAELNDLVLIADSIRDIICAKETGVKIISVAAGPTKYPDLKKAGADLVVDSLENKEEIIEFLS